MERFPGGRTPILNPFKVDRHGPHHGAPGSQRRRAANRAAGKGEHHPLYWARGSPCRAGTEAVFARQFPLKICERMLRGRIEGGSASTLITLRKAIEKRAPLLTAQGIAASVYHQVIGQGLAAAVCLAVIRLRPATLVQT